MEVPSLVWIFASFDFEQEVMPLPSSIIKNATEYRSIQSHLLIAKKSNTEVPPFNSQ